jgi:TolA-binding protein
MKGLLNHIFGSKAVPSEQELKDYLEGNLTNKERHALELKLQSDPLFAEAMDGFENHPNNINGLDKLQKEFYKKNSGRLTKLLLRSFLIIIPAGIITLLILLFNPFSKQESIITNEYTEETSPLNTTADTDMAEAFEQIDIAIAIPDSQIITSEVVKNDQKNRPKMDTVTEFDYELISETNDIQPIKKNLSNENIIELSNKIKKTILLDFWVIDYSKAYASSIKQPWIEHTGLDASHENEKSINNNSTEEIISKEFVPYLDYLEAALAKFKAKKYKDALRDFHVIHKYYPNDVNAFFYGGLCYYNIGMNKKAMAYFDKVLSNNIDFFHQDALFYKAQTLYQKKDTAELKSVLEQILTTKDFHGSYRQRSEKIYREFFGQ